MCPTVKNSFDEESSAPLVHRTIARVTAPLARLSLIFGEKLTESAIAIAMRL